MNAGELTSIWLVRVSMLLTLLSVLERLFADRNTLRLRRARVLWTAAYLLFCVHVLTAFHFVHHWSHVSAYEETARRTAETVGFAWGGGIWFNHAFLVLWGIDVAWWWTGIERYQSRPRWISGVLLGFLAFIIFNATVVFAQTGFRWWGIAGTTLVATCMVWRLRLHPSQWTKIEAGDTAEQES